MHTHLHHPPPSPHTPVYTCRSWHGRCCWNPAKPVDFLWAEIRHRGNVLFYPATEPDSNQLPWPVWQCSLIVLLCFSVPLIQTYKRLKQNAILMREYNMRACFWGKPLFQSDKTTLVNDDKWKYYTYQVTVCQWSVWKNVGLAIFWPTPVTKEFVKFRP